MSYRVVYGETSPAWEKILPTKSEAIAFAKKHEEMGDKIFSVHKVDPVKNPGPHSLMSAIEQSHSQT